MLKKLLSLVSLWIPLFLYAQGVTISGYTYDGLTQKGLANCRVSIKTSTMDTLLAQVTTVLQTERTEENGNVFVYQNTQIGALFMLQFNAPIDTVLKKCVSSKVLIFVVNKKNQRKNNEAYNRTKIGINF